MTQLLQQILEKLVEAKDILNGYGWSGVGLFAVVLVVLQMAMLPLSIFAVAGGAMFGFWKAFIAVTIGTNIGAIVNFVIARHVARDTVSRYLAKHEKFRLIDAAIGREGGKIIGMLRLCPLPFGLTNYCYGLTAVRFWPYVIATAIAITPGNLFFTWLGASAQEGLAAMTGSGRPRHPGEYVLLGVGLVAAFCALTYITRVAKAAVAKSSTIATVSPLQD